MKINSINSLMKFMLFDHKFHLFRGQSEARWPLESTMTRTLKANPRLSPVAAAAEQFTIRSFHRNAHLFDESFHHFKSCEFSTLTYIQHHGAPTRLLDVTASKFIALFFAFDGIDLSSGAKYVRIWYFDRRKLTDKTKSILGITGNDNLTTDPSKTWMDHINGKDAEALFVLPPVMNSKRSHVQSGFFICPATIKMSIHQIYESQYKDIVKFVDINKSLYENVNKLLGEVNLSHSTLYGGIESFSRDIRNRLVALK